VSPKAEGGFVRKIKQVLVQSAEGEADALRQALSSAYQDLAQAEQALKAVRSRRNRINDALGYEFVGEYVDPYFRATEQF
jgi:hypothetical protein